MHQGIRQKLPIRISAIIHRFKLDNLKNPFSFSRSQLVEKRLSSIGKPQSHCHHYKNRTQ